MSLTRTRDHQTRYAAGTRKLASRRMVSQVAGWLSPGPKQPHGADRPRMTAEATATVNNASSVAAMADESGSNNPAMRYTPNNISSGGSATAIAATMGGDKPSRYAVMATARSPAWPIFKMPATKNSPPSAKRTRRGTI